MEGAESKAAACGNLHKGVRIKITMQIWCRAVKEECDKLPQNLMYHVIQSMPRRVESCISLHDGHIPFY